jgi:hypothetical protein
MILFDENVISSFADALVSDFLLRAPGLYREGNAYRRSDFRRDCRSLGTITNNTTTSFLSALITVTLYDAHQKILRTLNGSVQNANGVLPGRTAVWTGVADGALHATEVEYVKAVPALVTPE